MWLMDFDFFILRGHKYDLISIVESIKQFIPPMVLLAFNNFASTA